MDRTILPNDAAFWPVDPVLARISPVPGGRGGHRAPGHRSPASPTLEPGTLVAVGYAGVVVLLLGLAGTALVASSPRGRVAGMTVVAYAWTMFAQVSPIPVLGLVAVRDSFASGTLAAPDDLWTMHVDHLGSVQLMTDENGDVVAGSETRYRVFGALRCTGNTCGTGVVPVSPRTFTGHRHDGEAGLLCMGARVDAVDIVQ